MTDKNNPTQDEPRWLEFLHARGLSDATISHFGIKPGRVNYKDPLPGATKKRPDPVECDPAQATGVVFPVYYPFRDQYTVRFKFFPENATAGKNRGRISEELPGGTLPAIYVPDANAWIELLEAIKHSGGILYLQEGEPDSWAIYEAGIRNAAGIPGSQNVKKTLPPFLERMGVRKIIYPADADNAGVASATKLYTTIRDAKIAIDTELLQHPSTYQGIQTKDANDIWLAAGQDRKTFEAYWYTELPKYPANIDWEAINNTGDTSRGANSEIKSDYDIKRLAAALIPAIEGVLHGERLEFKPDNWSQNVECIFHDHSEDERKKGAAYNRDQGIWFCQKGNSGDGQQFDVLQIAERVGFDAEPFRLSDAERRIRQKQTQSDVQYGYNLPAAVGGVQGGQSYGQSPDLGATAAPNVPPPNVVHESSQANRQEQIVAQTHHIAHDSATSHSERQRLNPVQVEVEKADPAEIYVRRSDLMHKAKKRAIGEIQDMDTFGVKFPIDHVKMANLGGYADILVAGKMALFIAPSGAGKTTVIKSMENRFNKRGVNTLVWSPEFDAVEQGDKTLQMESGINAIEFTKNDQWYLEKEMGVNEYAFGEAFEAAERESVIRAADDILSWPGDSYLINKFGMNVDHLIQMLDYTCRKAQEEDGKEIQVVFIDYVQLLTSPAHMKNWGHNECVLAIKNWANTAYSWVSEKDGKTVHRMRKKVVIFTSQAVKAKTTAIRNGDIEFLRAEDAMVLRPDWFNLIMSGWWGEWAGGQDSRGTWREYNLFVVKNTQGGFFDGNNWDVGVVPLAFEFKYMRLRWKSISESVHSGINPDEMDAMFPIAAKPRIISGPDDKSDVSEDESSAKAVDTYVKSPDNLDDFDPDEFFSGIDFDFQDFEEDEYDG